MNDDGTEPATARCCGSDICGKGLVGMFSLGGDLSRRAKDIVRGNDGISICSAHQEKDPDCPRCRVTI